MFLRENASLAYRDSAAEGTSGTGLVVLLYERLIQDVRGALAAMQAQLIEERTAAINHALFVLQHLQGTLDFSRGGEVAAQLNRFYSAVRADLLKAQISRSPGILEQQLKVLSDVKECWRQCDRSAQQVLPPKSRDQAAHEISSMDLRA